MMRADPDSGIVTVLFKHHRAVMTTFAVIFLAGLIYVLFAQTRYESVAQLVVKFGNQAVAKVDSRETIELTPADRREIILSHTAIILSRDLIRATVNNIGVGTIYPDIAAHPPAKWSAEDEAVARFRKFLWADVGAQNNVISVSFTHPDKAIAQTVLQKLLESYNVRQAAIYHDPHSDFLKSEVEQVYSHLLASQVALEQFKEQWHITDYDTEVAALLKQRGDIDDNLHAAQANLQQAQRRKTELVNLLRTVPERLPETANGERYRSLDEAQSRLSDLRSKQSQMLATYTADSPALASLNAGITTAEADVNTQRQELSGRSAASVNTVHQAVQTDYLRAVSDAESNAEPVQVMTRELGALDQRLSDLRKARGKFNDLTREHTLAEDIYRSLSTQYKDARVKDNINEQRISSVSMINKPSLPYRPARPRRLLTVLSAALAGVLLSIGVAMILESRDDKISTKEQMALFLGVPVFASFPAAGEAPPGREITVYGAS